MSKVGIVEAIGPASTMKYYREIIASYSRAAGAKNYPGIAVNSVDMVEMLAFTEADDYEGLACFLLDVLGELACAGADFAAIASNTPPHARRGRLRRGSAGHDTDTHRRHRGKAGSWRLRLLRDLYRGWKRDTNINHEIHDSAG